MKHAPWTLTWGPKVDSTPPLDHAALLCYHVHCQEEVQDHWGHRDGWGHCLKWTASQAVFSFKLCKALADAEAEEFNDCVLAQNFQANTKLNEKKFPIDKKLYLNIRSSWCYSVHCDLLQVLCSTATAIIFIVIIQWLLLLLNMQAYIAQVSTLHDNCELYHMHVITANDSTQCI